MLINPLRHLRSSSSSQLSSQTRSPDHANTSPATLDQILAHAHDLAVLHGAVSPGGRNHLLDSLRISAQELALASEALAKAGRAGHRLPPAAAWLIDNRLLVRSQVLSIRRHFPQSYSRRLPQLQRGLDAGLPRIFTLARDYISYADGHLDEVTLTRFIAAYQDIQPLQLGELWALPIALRLYLIDNLALLARRVMAMHQHTRAAAEWAKSLITVTEEHPTDLALELGRLATTQADPPPTFVAELTRRLQGRHTVLSVVNGWLSACLGPLGRTLDEDVLRHTQIQAVDQLAAEVTITSLRLLDEIDWRALVESTSVVERILRRDPVGIHALMDDDTRDAYRHAIEALARQADCPEPAVAEAAIALATAAVNGPRHVGHFLMGEERPALEQAIGLGWSLRAGLGRWYRRHGDVPYNISVLLGSGAVALALTCLTVTAAWPPWLVPLIALTALVAASQPTMQWVAWLHGRLLTPHRLPRLALRDGVGDDLHTLVVVPTMLRRITDALALADGLELRHLANRDSGLHFVLLTDFGDATQEHLPDDEAVLEAARAAIRRLNLLYRDSAGRHPFLLLHRPRCFNSSERCWMGRERKRGKLEDLNDLLLRGAREHFSVIDGDAAALTQVRHIIVLDTDTLLPPGAARRLVATLAHPLNRPQHADDGRVIAGHALLQPRVVISTTSAARSAFARLSAPEPGLDAYSSVAADLWQDLCGQGSFVGKGIYDLVAFDRVLRGRFPENTILSHDLIEGCYARSALVSDVSLVEDQPARLLADRTRRQRWMRGDWQIAPWLLPWVRDGRGRWTLNRLDHLARTRIGDNLRRALVAPATLALVLLDVLAGSGGWTIAVLAAGGLATPVIAGIPAALRRPLLVRWQAHLGTVGRGFVRELALLANVLLQLPSEAALSLHAMTVALWRMFISHTHRLEWLTSHDADAQARTDIFGIYQVLWTGPATAVMLVVAAGATPVALGLAGLWLLGPAVAWWLSRAQPITAPQLNAVDRHMVARTARATWRWFEIFIGPHSHWLPPDNVQEEPVRLTAPRTSPTNMGLALLADLAAQDLGYLPLPTLLERGEAMLSAMESLERHHGHFCNWYDIRILKPLPPRYVSTVDSGNLAGALLVLAQGLMEIPRRPIIPATIHEGLQTAFELLESACAHHSSALAAARTLSQHASEPLHDLATTAGRLEVIATKAASQEEIIHAAGGEAGWWLAAIIRQARGHAAFLRDCLDGGATTLVAMVMHPPGATTDAARAVIERAHLLAARATDLVSAMDFAFLYQPRRKLFAIGFQVEDHRLDLNCYDLLASEARLTSYLAVAQGQVPLEHWFTLGRQLIDADGAPALLSWSGSMFEYLMPELLMPELPGSLLALSNRTVLKRQIAYGKELGVPWGISESGYHLTDAGGQWQYRGFGVPGLGLKPGLADDVVVAPYASALALLIDAPAAVANLRRLQSDGLLGAYGFYEAVDYTPTRLAPGTTSAIIRSWMVHHQGMTLLACLHVLAEAPMRRRFSADPQLHSMELLLQERAPHVAPQNQDCDPVRPPSGPREDPAGLRVMTQPDALQVESQLLSNGRYHVLITAAGGGVSRANGHQLNRWHDDALAETDGLFCYLHDVERGRRWSTTHQPTLQATQIYEAVFSDAKAEFHRRDHDIDCTTVIAVPAEDDVELRRITLINHSVVPRVIELTTCAELVVGSGDADLAHQAFASLGVITRFVAAEETLLVRRRPRRAGEPAPVALHLMTIHGAEHSLTSCETDRGRFIGRGRTLRRPAALDQAGPLSGTTGPVLDAIAALRRRVLLPPELPVVIDVIWGLAASEEDALVLARRYRDRAMTDRVAGLAWSHARLLLHQVGISEAMAQAASQLSGLIIAPDASHRVPAGVVALNRRPRSALWPYGISGDLPLLLVRITQADDLPFARDCLGMHAWWHAKGLLVDVVLWNEDASGYRQDLHDRLAALIANGPSAGHATHPGGVFLCNAQQISADDRLLLMASTRLVLSAHDGALVDQAQRRPRPLRPVELLLPPRLPRSRAMAPAPLPGHLAHANGLGGFLDDGDYLVVLDPSATTPAPWINVLANPHFGALVSSSGASCTWAENCHEYRLTPWPADAVSENCGEALYLRDEEDGGFWSPSSWPASAPARYVVRHGAGVTSFTCHHDDLVSELLTFVAAQDPVRIWRWRIANRGERVRRLSLIWIGEAVLGEQRRHESSYLVSGIDALTGALTMRNPQHSTLGNRVVALDCNLRNRSVSGDRATVLGRNHGWDRPEALMRLRLDGRTGACLDPCLAMQTTIELAPGQERDVVFVLACGNDEASAAALVSRWRDPLAVTAGLAALRTRWEGLLGAVQVRTPEPSLDLLVNRWLPYQTIACRMWARGGFYQSGGAFGFRDQLQDAMALVHCDPAALRTQVLLAASRQFSEGDVQHWWHPPAGRGVRTHCSDDLLWLPLAIVRYVNATGDHSVLEESVPFLRGRAPRRGEADIYEMPEVTNERASLFEHGLRAILRAQTLGAHGLPLIGGGDWNDGFDRLGQEGRGESVWLAFFLHHVIASYLPLIRARQQEDLANELETWNTALMGSADEAWDGAWYRRAYDDQGIAVGSAVNHACRIDSIAQSWAVIAGVPDQDRARQAMESVDRELVDRAAGVVRIFHPPFSEIDGDPGYIRSYPEGVRENGGQYTHAAVWVALAYAHQKEYEKAWNMVRLLDPIRHSADPQRMAQRRTEPYVLCGDVYASAPWTGRGGWSWYTGSAGWLYRLLVEELLGVRLDQGALLIEPHLPAAWPGMTITYRHAGQTWNIVINRGERRTVVDGQTLADHRIGLEEVGTSHRVEVWRP